MAATDVVLLDNHGHRVRPDDPARRQLEPVSISRFVDYARGPVTDDSFFFTHFFFFFSRGCFGVT